jgi:cell division control protein 11
MVAGCSGSGKTTFLNTLCAADVMPPRKIPEAKEAGVEKTVEISPQNLDLDEDGTKIAITIIDTPGFGDSISNEPSFQEIVKYIEAQYDEILAQESRIKRNPKFQDNRVHAVLYFIQPSGHSLRENDIEFMKRLSPRANVIPVIAKADSMTKNEMKDFKARVGFIVDYRL